jgi:hypothetical protein
MDLMKKMPEDGFNSMDDLMSTASMLHKVS